ncbi:AMN1 [Candida margitis]|uniref:AMN1 n=1 Tax=Candida margitis TaxID=1775924 RepID=UPI002226DAF0|nr:AMN1 [Candida margitis]KAI5953944.1 AMN1 [Candida margitis]
MSYNPTEPLPYDSSRNCPIYNPFSSSSYSNEEVEEEAVGESTPLKKARRVVSSNSLSAFLQRSRKGRRNVSTSGNSRRSSQWLTGDEIYNSSYSSPSSSDLESLPDLTDDDVDTPETTPVKPGHKFTFLDTISPGKKLVFTDDAITTTTTAKKQETHAFDRKKQTKISIFDIPELVHRILLYVEAQNDCQPHEVTPIRRKPLSYNHALLIYGDKHSAQQAMAAEDNGLSQNNTHTSPLFNCLLVNKLFNKIARELLATKFYFSNDVQFSKYVETTTTPSTSTFQFQPQSFSLHKLFHTNQLLFNQAIINVNFLHLTSFELFMCPKIYPSWEIFQSCGSKLQSLIITGSKTIDDKFCYMVSHFCHNLTHLDLRACELITDSGLYHIFKANSNLQSVNIGRKNKGYLITDASIAVLVRNNCHLHTLGLAGTYISDIMLWHIGQLKKLERLSLNNCPRLTNSGVANVLNHTRFFPHLTVLELRFNLQLTDLTSLIHFKNRKNYQYYHHHKGVDERADGNSELLLVELCETLMYRMRRQELDLDKLISSKIMNDILYWINDRWESDGDLPYMELLNSRKRKRQ